MRGGGDGECLRCIGRFRSLLEVMGMSLYTLIYPSNMLTRIFRSVRHCGIPLLVRHYYPDD